MNRDRLLEKRKFDNHDNDNDDDNEDEDEDEYEYSDENDNDDNSVPIDRSVTKQIIPLKFNFF